MRTSGPINAHLTPCPGIYFNASIHVYSSRAGADNPLGSTESPYHFAHLLQVLKQSIHIFFFMFLHMYIAPGRGRQHTVDTILITTERPFLFAHMLNFQNDPFEI